MTWLDICLGIACLCGGVTIGICITSVAYERFLRSEGYEIVEEDENDK